MNIIKFHLKTINGSLVEHRIYHAEVKNFNAYERKTFIASLQQRDTSKIFADGQILECTSQRHAMYILQAQNISQVIQDKTTKNLRNFTLRKNMVGNGSKKVYYYSYILNIFSLPIRGGFFYSSFDTSYFIVYLLPHQNWLLLIISQNNNL